MKRDSFIKDLHVIGNLLDHLSKVTHKKLEENRKIRKLLELPNTVHNKTSLKNYLNSTIKCKQIGENHG